MPCKARTIALSMAVRVAPSALVISTVTLGIMGSARAVGLLERCDDAGLLCVIGLRLFDCFIEIVNFRSVGFHETHSDVIINRTSIFVAPDKLRGLAITAIQ